jgi:hypothetical protein
VRARPLRASQTPHQYGNSLSMVPMHNFEKPCTAPFLHRKPPHSSPATSAPLHPPPQSLNGQVRKSRRCARPKCAPKVSIYAPNSPHRQINFGRGCRFCPKGLCATSQQQPPHNQQQQRTQQQQRHPQTNIIKSPFAVAPLVAQSKS